MKQAIIIVGGYNSLWTAYLKMARDLEDVSGLRAIGVPLAPWDWLKANRQEDGGHILQKIHETVLWFRRRHQVDRLILVGHSAGGIMSRLYLTDRPVWGYTYAGSEHVTCLITLGSPHCTDQGTATGWFLSSMANKLTPGAPNSDRPHFRTVAGRSIQGRRDGQLRERRAFRAYEFFTGAGDTWGDGTTPVEGAALPGAEPLVLEGIVHSRKIGANWYGGSRAIIGRWWPQELVNER